jgi:hypothetical protein
MARHKTTLKVIGLGVVGSVRAWFFLARDAVEARRRSLGSRGIGGTRPDALRFHPDRAPQAVIH